MNQSLPDAWANGGGKGKGREGIQETETFLPIELVVHWAAVSDRGSQALLMAEARI